MASILGTLPQIAVWVVVATLFWAPLPFASVGVGADALLKALVFVAMALAVVGSARPARRVAWPAGVALALAAIGVLQSLPWPRAWVAAVSPRHARLAQAAESLLHGDLADGGGVPLSLAPGASRAAALSWLAIAAALVLGAILGRSRRSRRWMAGAVVSAAVFQVLFGARHLLSRSTEIWGVEMAITGSRLRGTFVNPNHLATYLGVALAIVFAWAWWGIRQGRWELSWERRLLLAGPPLLLWMTLFTGLAFTGSRAGLAAAALGVVAQGTLLAISSRHWKLLPIGIATAVGGLLAVSAVGFEKGLGRWLGTSVYEVTWGARAQVAQATLDLWRLFPWSGSGLGSFRDAFLLVQPAEVTGAWWHAHSDWLELLATGGPVAAALLLLGLGRLLWRLRRVLLRGRRSEDRLAALAALGALATVGAQEAVDFGLTMPATAVTLALVVGAGAGTRTESSHRHRPAREREIREDRGGAARWEPDGPP